MTEIIKELMEKNYNGFRQDHIDEITRAKHEQILMGQWKFDIIEQPKDEAFYYVQMCTGEYKCDYFTPDDGWKSGNDVFRWMEIPQ